MFGKLVVCPGSGSWPFKCSNVAGKKKSEISMDFAACFGEPFSRVEVVKMAGTHASGFLVRSLDVLRVD
jgi:hypothetical protein